MRLLWYAVRLLTAAGLAVDAYVHAADAQLYDGSVTGSISQGDLFRIEAGVASLLALLVLVWPRRGTWAAAFVVAASALGGVVLYRYVDVGALGPIPDMYEPTWQAPHKLTSAYAEGAAVALSLIGLSLRWRLRRPRDRAHT